MAGVLEDDQLNGGVDPLGQLIPFVVGEIGGGIVEIHVLQTGDLIAHIRLFATLIRYIGPVPGEMKDQDVSCPGSACQPVPLREKLCLDNLLIFQCVDFFWSEAEVADQKIADIMDIIHAALEGGRCIAVDTT